MASVNSVSHDEAWLSLPWLASGRLPQAERDRLEPHVQTCAACRAELALQRHFCNALTEPERVIYAPGPSFRKLMDRIDGVTRTEGSTRNGCQPKKPPIAPTSRRWHGRPAIACALVAAARTGLGRGFCVGHRAHRRADFDVQILSGQLQNLHGRRA